MLAKMIDKIVSLKQTQTFQIHGDTYADNNLVRIPPHVDRPKTFDVSGLDSIVKMIRQEHNNIGVPVFVNVEGHQEVGVYTSYLPDYSRNFLYRATADVPGFPSGWREQDRAIIELRSLCIPGEGTEYLLDLLSRMSDEQTVTTNDNGVTQQVEARQGISLSSMIAVRPRVNLQPFRTFLEVPQPESEFLLRVDSKRGIAFFEADGGVWKLEAKRNIAGYFERELEDLIRAGEVVVMY